MDQGNARVGCIYSTRIQYVCRYTAGVGIDIRFICCLVFGDTTFPMNEIGSHVLCIYIGRHREPDGERKKSQNTYGNELQGYLYR